MKKKPTTVVFRGTKEQEEKLLADINGDKIIDNLDVEEIYRIYTGG